MADFPIAVEITLPFTGWQAFHHEDRFWDIIRVEGSSIRGLMFHAPTNVYGADGPEPATTAEQAVALLAAKPGATVSSPAEVVIDGKRGLSVDVSAAADDTELFGSQRPLLGIGPEEDVRLAFFGVEGQLLSIGTLAAHGELDAAADVVAPIVASIRIGR